LTHPAADPSGADIPAFGPLQGIRIIDLTVALAGAFATMLLADMGAEVIKVESLQHYPTPSRGPRNPARGDSPIARAVGRDYPGNDPGDDPWNRLSWFNSHARNKRSFTVDLSRPRGRELFRQLVEKSDGLVENNTAGLLERLNIGPDDLQARNPRLIVVRMPPLGLSGPDMGATGFGWHFEELGGFLEVQGYTDGPEVGSIFMDAASGPAGANAFLMALLERRRTGRGQLMEVAQVENMIVHIGDAVMEAAMTGACPPRRGNRTPEAAPQGVYPCAGDDQWLAISVGDDEQWARLVDLIGGPPELRRLELADRAGRAAAHDEIDAAIAGWTATRTKEELFHLLQGEGVVAGPVLDEADAASDPQLQARQFFHYLEHPSAGAHFHPGANFQLPVTPTRVWRAAPVLGQDNEYVYKQILGVTDEQYERLRAEGHVGDTFL
jgi:crotonobetainyl-CoA:carnitine CoA-transferase CaiB-like acyl-CoA transferase